MDGETSRVLKKELGFYIRSHSGRLADLFRRIIRLGSSTCCHLPGIGDI